MSLGLRHNLFLHSALALSRKVLQSDDGIKEACRYYLIETGIAHAVGFVINVCVIAVSGKVCNSPGLSAEDQKKCSDLDLDCASFLLRHVLGKWSSTLFAISLLASGQSSTITGTYAGQYVMQRILSFELPLALVPLLKFTSSKEKMGSQAKLKAAVAWIVGLLLMGINIYYLLTSFTDVVFHGKQKLSSRICIGVFGFAATLVYLAAIEYLVFRKSIKTNKSVQSDHNSHKNMQIPVTPGEV